MSDATTVPSTLSELLTQVVARHGDRPAIIESRHTLLWRDIGALAEGYAAQLRSVGTGRGDRVALWLPNSADYLALVFAVARIGAIAVHINTRFRAHELGSLLHRVTPVVLVAGVADHAEIFDQVAEPDKSSLKQILIPGGIPPERRAGAIPVAPLRAGGKAPDTARPEDPCAMFTTSGSTGEPKLVLHGQRGLAAHHFFASRTFGFDQPDAVLLANVPFCGAYGHTRLLMAVAGGAAIALQDSADIGALIRNRRVTHMAGFADTLARVIESAHGHGYNSMRVFSVAPSPFVDNEAVYAEAGALGLTLRTAYGSTEACPCFAVLPDGWDPVPGGAPTHPDSRFVIRDPETGRDCPEGEAGALLISGPSMFLRYHDDPAATSAAWTEDGMYRTGDRAYRRGNGFVFVGRYDEAMRLGGFLVDPAEIETFLRQRPEVAQARVVGADLGKGAKPVAFVIARKGCVVDEAVLLEACREQIASFKVPARIIALDEFPVSDGANATKIRLDVLRDLAATLR